MNIAIRSAVIAYSALFLVAGCARSAQDDGFGSLAQPLSVPLDVDFSAYPLGALGSPWIVHAGGPNSAATVINSSADHGKALLIHVKPVDGESLTAELPVSGATAPNLNLQFQVKPGPKSNFQFTLRGTKVGYKNTRFSLQRVPGSKQFTVSSKYPHSDCGTLPDNAWSTVALNVRNAAASSATIDVRINGVLKPECTGITSTLRAPFTEIDLLEYFDFGTKTAGDVTFDNFYAESGVN